jgi:hypothetical protein
MAGSFVVLALLATLIIFVIDSQYFPVYFWTIPVFFLLLTLALGWIVKNYLSREKQLTIGSILGIRVLFISLIIVFIIINIWIDKAHIVSFTLISVVFAVVFSFFETRILLMLNKKN